MLNVTNVTIRKEATLTVQDVEYRVIYELVNGIVNLISCSIVKTVEGVFTAVGNINKENGQVNSFIHETEDYIQHLTQFKDIVAEVEKELISE